MHIWSSCSKHLSPSCIPIITSQTWDSLNSLLLPYTCVSKWFTPLLFGEFYLLHNLFVCNYYNDALQNTVAVLYILSFHTPPPHNTHTQTHTNTTHTCTHVRTHTYTHTHTHTHTPHWFTMQINVNCS